ncbi:helix-turn-helix transcriptional regulator [Cohnella suwonensis]|uniref:Helix-turn-helix transcriptional regulator n=1 Tax=Cohnella suwonensis TaxID=696072 RepID=A0ABW0LNJ2_9BACL
MKLERLISMIYMLLNHEILSASELADKYKVSQRTIYRDIDAICAAGIPIVSYQGVNGGYGIVEEYKMDRSLLGSYDVGSLITVLQGMSTVFRDDKAMETVRKLQTIQQENGMPSLSLDIENRRLNNKELRSIRSAITSKHIVRFDYIDAKNDRTSRKIEPASLMYKNQSWYVYGFCLSRQDYREFKLSRIVELAVLPETFSRVHNVRPQEGMPDWSLRPEPAKVVVHFLPNALAKALDVFMGADKTFNEDGSLTLTLNIGDASHTEWLMSLVLGFGDRAVILEPPELRERFEAKLRSMLGRYEA